MSTSNDWQRYTPEQARALVAFDNRYTPAFQVGQRVLILAAGELAGQPGTIYGYLPGRPHPWFVRPEDWPEDVPGVALMAGELLADRVTVLLKCEACGDLFEPEDGYIAVERTDAIGYAYCSGCYDW